MFYGPAALIYSLFFVLNSCQTTQDQSEKNIADTESTSKGARLTMKTSDLGFEVVIHKPKTKKADAILLFHGTVEKDDKTILAARKTLAQTRNLLKTENLLLISVAYPQENQLMGDNLKIAEAALLWAKNQASKELGIEIQRLFLLGHSQGGYIVTRLNTMHSTDGVIANAPGPLNFKLRCELEETGKIPSSNYCQLMKAKYGTTAQNPTAYFERSLLSHIQKFKSKILFTQGTDDKKIQMTSWPVLKQKVKECAQCQSAEFVELQGGHGALFENPQGGKIISDFFGLNL